MDGKSNFEKALEGMRLAHKSRKQRQLPVVEPMEKRVLLSVAAVEAADANFLFHASGNGSNPITSWSIDWGDGNNQTDPSPDGSSTHASNHVYAEDGVYNVNIIAYWDATSVDSDTDTTYGVTDSWTGTDEGDISEGTLSPFDVTYTLDEESTMTGQFFIGQVFDTSFETPSSYGLSVDWGGADVTYSGSPHIRSDGVLYVTDFKTHEDGSWTVAATVSDDTTSTVVHMTLTVTEPTSTRLDKPPTNTCPTCAVAETDPDPAVQLMIPHPSLADSVPGGIAGGPMGGAPSLSARWNPTIEYSDDLYYSPYEDEVGVQARTDGHILGDPTIADDGSAVVIGFGGVNLFFTNTSGAYSEDYDNGDSLAYSATTHRYTLQTADGTLATFYGPTLPLYGHLDTIVDPSGDITNYIYTSTTLTETVKTIVSSTITTKQSTTYSYTGSNITNALLRTKTWDTALGQTEAGTSYLTANQVVYGYSGTRLQTATTEDGSGNVVGTTYFRYWSSGDSVGGVAQPDGAPKMALYDASYARAAAALSGTTTVLAATDAQLAPYADEYYEYNTDKELAREIKQGAGCSACSGGQGTYLYSYASNPRMPDGPNAWLTMTAITQPDGTVITHFYNFDGQSMLDVTSDGVHNWGTFTKYDSSYRPIWVAQPSAVSLPASLLAIEQYDDLLHNVSGNYQFLNDNSGLITTTSYYSSTSATATNSGSAAGFVSDTYIQQGELGTSVHQENISYFAVSGGGAEIFPIANDTVYGSAAGTDARTTANSYSFYTGTVQVKLQTTSYATISSGQNGPGTADTVYTFYDAAGRVIWTKDADGHVGYNAYERSTGAAIKSIADVNYSSLSSAEQSLFSATGWSNPSGLNLVSTYSVDSRGRTIEQTSPNGNQDFYVFNDQNHEVRVYPGFDGTNTTGPIQVSRTYFPAANSGYLYYTETLTTSATPHLTSGLPDGTESITGSNIQSLQRDFYNAGGQMIWSDRYFSFSGLSYSQPVSLSGGVPADLGTLGTHYYRTTLGYDEAGRQNEVIAPTGTININVFNAQGQITSQWIGTTDTHTGDDWTPATNTGNMMDVQDNVYDGTHDFISPPSAPSLSSTSGGSLAGSIFYVVITYLGSAGETLGSSQSNLTISANHLLTVASPSSSTGATSYNVYVGTLSSGESLQTSTPITIGTNWTEPTTGMVSTGVAVPEDIGDGNLTKVTMHPGLSQADRVINYLYDFEDRQVAEKDGVQSSESDGTHRPILYNVLDNQGEILRMYQFDGDGVSLNDFASTAATDGIPTAGASKVRALSVNGFDDQNRLYRTQVFNIDQTNGTSGLSDTAILALPNLQTDTFYDHRSNVIATYSANGLVTKDVYDGSDRVTTEYTTDGGAVNNSGTQRKSWSDAGLISNDLVLTQSEFTYDADGNVILTVLRDRFDNDSTSSTGSLGSPSSGVGARDSYVADYYDHADRLTDEANVGTNGGSAYTRPGSAPSRSDAVLVTHTAYDPAGNPNLITDPRNVMTQYNFDMLARVVGEIDNSDGGSPATGSAITGFTYDGDDNVLTTVAYFPGSSTPTQTTAFIMGIGGTSGTNLFSNDVISKIEYPIKTGGSAGSPDTTSSGSASYGYDLLGDVLTKTDQNANVHTYSRDILGRLKLDAVTTLGSGVDGSIRALGYTFNSLDLPYQQTISYSNSSATTVVNQVQNVYNGYGQLITQYQEHSGAVNTGTSLNVQYAYSQPSGANYSRLSSMTYPNGRIEDYVYNTGLDSDISRVSGISDDAGTGAGSAESYTYLGLDTIVQRTDGNGIALTYIKQSGESNGDAGDQYIGLDRFGRVVDQRYIPTGSPSSPTDRFQYAYDRDSNVLYKNNVVSTSFSELYHANSSSSGDNATAYDSINRLIGFRRGTLSASGNNGSGVLDTVGTLNTLGNSQQSFTLDAVGNQTSITTDGTATTRTVDSQNQVTAVGATSLGYDNNGNMATDDQGHTLVYDAWNRLVQAKNGLTTLTSYSFDADGNRIVENPGTVTHIYFSSAAQPVEERQGSTVTGQYVWGLGYVNDIILRDDNSTSGSFGKSGSGLGRRAYYQQDANYNVTSITNTSGAVLQRYIYTPYGLATVLTASWGASSESYGNVIRNQGARYDAVTGITHLFRRDDFVRLDVWGQQDGGFWDGMDLYQVELSNPVRFVDPSGMEAVITPTLPTAPPIGGGGASTFTSAAGATEGGVSVSGGVAGEVTVTAGAGITEGGAVAADAAAVSTVGAGIGIGTAAAGVGVVAGAAYDAYALYQFGSGYAQLKGSVAGSYAQFGTPIVLPRNPPKGCKDWKNHHIATYFNNEPNNWPSQFMDLFKQGGIKSLHDPINICPVCKKWGREHRGPHDEEYHQRVLDMLTNAVQDAKAAAPNAKGGALQRVIKGALQEALNQICDDLNKPSKLRDMVTEPCGKQ
jgi:YD repeat-containing protein